MRFFVRIYRRYDFDLYTLAINGYRIDDLIRDSVTAYAHGVPFHVYMDKVLPPSEPSGKGKILYNITIESSDRETIEMLRHIVKGFRNNFCKACARNALLKQNLSVYFTKKEYLTHEKVNMIEYTTVAMKGLHSIGVYADPDRSKRYLTDFLNGENAKEKAVRKPLPVITGEEMTEETPHIDLSMPVPDIPESIRQQDAAPENPRGTTAPAPAAPKVSQKPTTAANPAAVTPSPSETSAAPLPVIHLVVPRTDTTPAEPDTAAASADDTDDIMAMFNSI